jgi:diketogulonate reductase-like aldo/keto reductase
MPTFGFGCFQLTNIDAVRYAVVDCGYRLLDNAHIYGNEAQIGDTLTKTVFKKVPRKDLYIVSKLWVTDVENVEAACKKTIANLKCDYLDLYLIHWPMFMKPPATNKDGTPKREKLNFPMHKVWPQMEKLVDKGLVKSIGISNFNVQMMWDLLSYARIKPAVNQVELHPYCSQQKLVEFMKKNGIQPMAYAPTARSGNSTSFLLDIPDIKENPIIKSLCKKYKKTPAQVLLNWGLQRGHVVIPKSNTPAHIKENFESQSFTLAPKEVDSITSLERNHRMFDELATFLNTGIFS